MVLSTNLLHFGYKYPLFICVSVDIRGKLEKSVLEVLAKIWKLFSSVTKLSEIIASIFFYRIKIATDINMLKFCLSQNGYRILSEKISSKCFINRTTKTLPNSETPSSRRDLNYSEVRVWGNLG